MPHLARHAIAEDVVTVTPTAPDGVAVQRRHILMLLDKLTADRGGAERLAANLAMHLPRERFRVTLCATRALDARWSAQLAEAGVAHLTLGRTKPREMLPFRRLAAFLRTQHVDVLHAHLFGSNVWGTLIGRVAGTPVVIAHEHTWSYEGQPLRKLLDGQLVGRFADAFFAVSAADRDRMVSLERVPREKVIVEPNGYVARPPSPRFDLRSSLGLAPDTPLVGTVSVQRPQKALHVLVQAFATLRTQRPDAHLVLVGDGECRPQLESQVASLGLSGRVHFLGLREDVDAILPNLDVAALSSDFEGTPLFAFECMAAGVPLVATRVGGVPDLLEDGVAAVLVPRRNPQALASAVAALLDDPIRRGAIADAARSLLARHSMHAMAERFGDHYDRLLAAASRNGRARG